MKQFLLTLYAFFVYDIMIGQIVYPIGYEKLAYQVQRIYLKEEKIVLDISWPYTRTIIGWFYLTDVHANHPDHIKY